MKRTKKLFFAAAAVIFAGGSALFIYTRMWQRSDIDAAWANRIVADSLEIRQVLGDYRSSTGEFPESLERLSAAYKQPTEFDDRKSVHQWHYRKVSESDYQVFATGASFVSSFDAMVFRYSGRYPKRWFRTLDSSHSKKFGDWYYITGFSSFEQDP